MAKNRPLVLALSVTLLAGCADSTGSTEPGAAAPTALPTLTRPTAPPSEPTDQIKQTTIVVGTVTRGGTGPCYGLTTDDGVQYALYEAKGRELTVGARIEADTTPSRLRIDCGPGTLVEVSALSPLR